MALRYHTGEEIHRGDRVTYGGNAGVIELVVEALTGKPEEDWLFETNGTGIMAVCSSGEFTAVTPPRTMTLRRPRPKYALCHRSGSRAGPARFFRIFSRAFFARAGLSPSPHVVGAHHRIELANCSGTFLLGMCGICFREPPSSTDKRLSTHPALRAGRSADGESATLHLVGSQI